MVTWSVCWLLSLSQREEGSCWTWCLLYAERPFLAGSHAPHSGALWPTWGCKTLLALWHLPVAGLQWAAGMALGWRCHSQWALTCWRRSPECCLVWFLYLLLIMETRWENRVLNGTASVCHHLLPTCNKFCTDMLQIRIYNETCMMLKFQARGSSQASHK